MNSGQETHAGPAPEQANASSDKSEAPAVAEANSEAHATDADAAAAAEEAAGSEEMSKLMEQYDEKQEAAAANEIIKVKVVAYTEHGVVVDLAPIVSNQAAQSLVASLDGVEEALHVRGFEIDTRLFDPSLVQASSAGSIRIDFTDANSAVITYTVSGVTATKTITRQLF